MRNSKLSFIQKSLGNHGGGVHTLPLTYKISPEPISDVNLYGYLAHVTDATRKKIMASGAGEMAAHIEHIKARIGTIRKLKNKAIAEQIAMEF